MNIKGLFTEEELKDIDEQESIAGQPNWDVVKYWIDKHYKELEINQVLELIKLNYLEDIKFSLEYIIEKENEE